VLSPEAACSDGSFAGARTAQQPWFGPQGMLGNGGTTIDDKVSAGFGQQ